MEAEPCDLAATTLAEKVAFLRGAAYPRQARAEAARETHMSWVFFVDGNVYKLKKPVRAPFLDFSTLARRGEACAAEVELNRTLAPGVYLGVDPLVRGPAGLQIGGRGEVVDWLVRMRRLDEARTLESKLRAGTVRRREVDALCDLLVSFYRKAPRRRGSPSWNLAERRAALACDRKILLEPAFGLPVGVVRATLSAQEAFLRFRGGLLADRVREGRVLEVHGDLRPEHIWLGPPIRIIDRLEFSRELRTKDPLEEIAFLDLETERLGRPDIGRRIRRRVIAGLHERPAPELFAFYRCAQALLRARLAIAHLQEPHPRTPWKWPLEARAYLAMALRDSRRATLWLRRPSGP